MSSKWKGNEEKEDLRVNSSSTLGHVLELLEAALDCLHGHGLLLCGHVLGHRLIVDGDVVVIDHAQEELAIRRVFEKSVYRFEDLASF